MTMWCESGKKGIAAILQAKGSEIEGRVQGSKRGGGGSLRCSGRGYLALLQEHSGMGVQQGSLRFGEPEMGAVKFLHLRQVAAKAGVDGGARAPLRRVEGVHVPPLQERRGAQIGGAHYLAPELAQA
jgi:hypothetical protein